MLYHTFNPHAYYFGTVQYQSITTNIGSYQKEFNSPYWSLYKTAQELNKDFIYQKSKQEPSEEEIRSFLVDFPAEQVESIRHTFETGWNDNRMSKAQEGTWEHKKREDQSNTFAHKYNRFTQTWFPVREHCKETSTEKWPLLQDLAELQDGFYAEIIVWTHEYRMAGTIDKLFIETIGGKRYVDIDDYKTGKPITLAGYGYMRHPLGILPASNYNKYKLQVNYYATFLEMSGFIPRHMGFKHINLKTMVESNFSIKREPYPIGLLLNERAVNIAQNLCDFTIGI